jgi:hypothetical protein
MKETVWHNDKCLVKQANSSKVVEAEVMNFNEKKNLTVVLNKSVKLLMSWNGRFYEGRMAGLEFTSNGPNIRKSQGTIRG